jgi:NADPH2:quinone reductase
MKAAWYERQGPAAEVFVIGETPIVEPGPGEVRISVVASGINPGDVKKRDDRFGAGMAYDRVIPHSDGAGVIDAVGDAVPRSRVGERVWCFGAQSYRPFGTAAEFVVLPAGQVVPLSPNVAFEQGACLGIAGITAHRAVHVAGPVRGKWLLVQGGGGAVGQCAVALARHAGARVVATVRSEEDRATAERAGALHVVVTDNLRPQELVERIRARAPDGIDHVVEVAFDANIALDESVLRLGGSIATYATGNPMPAIPFWPLVFNNVSVFFLGSDDFSAVAKAEAARSLNEVLERGWPGFTIRARFPLEEIARAHEAIERGARPGRVVLSVRREGQGAA